MKTALNDAQKSARKGARTMAANRAALKRWEEVDKPAKLRIEELVNRSAGDEMNKLWHRIEHKPGWFSGHVVSRTDQEGHIFIGFMCNKCSMLTGEHDASAVIDRHLRIHQNRGTK